MFSISVTQDTQHFSKTEIVKDTLINSFSFHNGTVPTAANREISDCHIILGPIVPFGDKLSPPIPIQNVTIVRLSRLSHGDNRRQY